MKNTNKQAVKATLDALINKKLQRESTEIKFKEIYASKAKMMFVFSIPTEDETMDIFDQINANKTTKSAKVIYTEMMYKHCAILQEKELQTAYNVVDPLDIVSILFSTKDIMKIGNEIIKETGFGEDDDEIKN